MLRSTLAGHWYPADAALLKEQLDGFLAGLDSEPLHDVIAVILPHAGYEYSGSTAIKALARSRRQYHRIVVIGPSHRMSMPEICSLPDVSHYETPLGEVALDRTFVDTLVAQPGFEHILPAHQGEHSVQIELPLLQHLFADFRLVPIVAGQLSLATSQRVAAILKGLLDQDTLMVVSSDFTHYGPRFEYVPFSDDIASNLRTLDLGAYAHIEALDAPAFVRYQEETGATICGRVPIAILLSMLDQTHRWHLVEYTTSGRLTGDYRNSVSYLSARVRGHWTTPGQG
ncbi:MAG: AmmeMemoRadiSam system protein B [Planctomycetes bacterium]|nr:AmmeMemoRadiSam system protein B [Planctomycetota bacterium]